MLHTALLNRFRDNIIAQYCRAYVMILAQLIIHVILSLIGIIGLVHSIISYFPVLSLTI
jgi:hypothetical protein